MNQPAPSQPLPVPTIWGESNVGKQRNHNEDQVYPDTRHKTSLRPPTPQAVQERGYLLVVSDGIGGAQVGDTAANFAVRSVTDHYYADPRALPLDKLLQSAVEVANTNVHNYVRTSPAFQQAGCTLTAAAIRGSELVVAHVGDSRAYLLQDGGIHQLTIDHNVAQMMASGQPLPGGGQGLAGNMLVRSLGAGPAVEVDVKRFILKPGDTVLLCSDGLHGVVSDDEIRQIAGKETPEKGARKLIDLANARGGPDNISAVIARIPGSLAPAAAGAGRKSSNRITALAIAVLGLLAVLAVMLFALNQRGGDGAAATATTTVAAIASPPSTETATPPPAEAGVVTAMSTPVAIATASPDATASPATVVRPPTSTPIPAATATPTKRPTNTPSPTRPRATPLPTRPQGSTSPVLAPVLQSPPNGPEQRNEVTLQWNHGGLQSGQQYRVDLRTDYNQPMKTLFLFSPGTSLQVRFDQYPLFFKDDNTTFFWSVVVINADGSMRSGRSEEWRFVWRQDVSPAVANTPAPQQATDTPPTQPTDTPPTQPTDTPTTQPTNTPTKEGPPPAATPEPSPTHTPGTPGPGGG